MSCNKFKLFILVAYHAMHGLIKKKKKNYFNKEGEKNLFEAILIISEMHQQNTKLY